MIRTSPTGHVYRTPKRARHKEPQKVTTIPRLAHTYRSNRRNDWRSLDGVTWLEHNETDGRDKWHIGTIQRPRMVRSWAARSKYMPHIGKKERARHAPA